MDKQLCEVVYNAYVLIAELVEQAKWDAAAIECILLDAGLSRADAGELMDRLGLQIRSNHCNKGGATHPPERRALIRGVRAIGEELRREAIGILDRRPT